MDPNRNINNIPEEILFDILTLLPVKSLSRFRCVSKHWFSIISDPDFVAAHSSRSKSRPKLLFSVTTRSVSHDKLNFYSIEYPEEDQRPPSLSLLHATAHGSIEPINSFYEGIPASASGLICCNCDQGIRIGNPITGEFNLIHHRYTASECAMRCYLGFDPIEKRGIVLELDYSLFQRKSLLFSLLAGSQWYDIPRSDPPIFIYYPSESAICMNGVIYFTAYQVNFNDDRCLYAFDVRLKCLEMIQCPPVLRRGLRFNTPMIEYKDRRVALVCSENEDGVRHYKLWILEDPKKHSWSCKSFAVPSPEGNDWRSSSKFCGATHRGELMFVTELSTEGSLQLFLFEIDTNTLRMYQVDGFGLNESDRRIVQLKFLIESLHSPNKSNLSIPI